MPGRFWLHLGYGNCLLPVSGVFNSMIHFDRSKLEERLGLRPLIARINSVMSQRPKTPLRQCLSDPTGRELLVMPAILGDYAGVKSLSVIPANQGTPRPVISGLFTLFSLRSGEPLATMDAGELTVRRTSAISACAAEKLARPESSTLTVLGAGHLAPYMVAAHASVRPIQRILLWARNPDRALAAVGRIQRLLPADASPMIETVSDLESAVRAADIVTSATAARAPLIKGEWLRPGTHVDLVGSYKPDMREIDDDGIRRSTVFVDERNAALSEAGDLTDPIGRGVIAADKILGDLADLSKGTVGRQSHDELTLFKSVGIGIADLVAAIEVWERGTSGAH